MSKHKVPSAYPAVCGIQREADVKLIEYYQESIIYHLTYNTVVSRFSMFCSIQSTFSVRLTLIVKLDAKPNLVELHMLVST